MVSSPEMATKIFETQYNIPQTFSGRGHTWRKSGVEFLLFDQWWDHLSF